MKIKVSSIAYMVTSIFALGGGFLSHVGPPVRFSHFITGAGQVIVLVAGFLILSIRTELSTKIKAYSLLAIGVLLFAGIYFYYGQYGAHVTTLPSNDSLVVTGSVHTVNVLRTCGKLYPDYAGCETYYLKLSTGHTFIGVEDIWTSDSILKNELRLLVIYWFLSLLLGAAVFLIADEEKKDGPAASNPSGG